MICVLTFPFVFYGKIYTYILVHAKTISGRIPKKLVLLAASGEKEGIWENQTQESYFPLFLFFILFDFLPCAYMTLKIIPKHY